MSFSKQFTGKAAIVLAAIAAFPAEQKVTDEGHSASPGVVEGHAKQIAASTTVLDSLIAATPPDADLSVSIWGHANADESGNFGYSVAVSGLATAAVASPD